MAKRAPRMTVLPETKVPSAPFFLDVGLGMVLSAVLFAAEPLPVPVARGVMIAEVVTFSKRMWGELLAVAEAEDEEVVLMLEVVDTTKDELEKLELVVELKLLELVVEIFDDEDEELVVEVLDDVVDVELGVVEVELVEVDVGEGEDEVVGVGVGVGLALLELEGLEDDEEPDEPPPEFEFPASKTTMLAVCPLGTVTTQKLAPPAPDA